MNAASPLAALQTPVKSMSSILETLNRKILKIVYFLVVIWSYVPLKNVLVLYRFQAGVHCAE